MASEQDLFVRALNEGQDEIVKGWLGDLKASGVRRDDLMREQELAEQCQTLVRQMAAASQASGTNTNAPDWSAVHDYLNSISRTRAQQGFAARDTAFFIFAMKRPIFEAIRTRSGKDGDLAARTIVHAAEVVDALAVQTIESYMRGREEVINRQQQELLELSTPVVKLWDGVLALPMIGTLDSARTQVVMESLLQKIVETGSEIAILDITGVPMVDTLVAQHLLKTVAAARLMGAECIISGIRPQIAQTIVHLGVDLKDVMTKATLADAFAVALQRLGRSVVADGK